VAELVNVPTGAGTTSRPRRHNISLPAQPHIVFSTKNREPLIDRELKERLDAYMGGLIRERKGALLSAGGTPDHVHLLVSMGREWAVANLVRDVKSSSSGWVHDSQPPSAVLEPRRGGRQ